MDIRDIGGGRSFSLPLAARRAYRPTVNCVPFAVLKPCVLRVPVLPGNTS